MRKSLVLLLLIFVTMACSLKKDPSKKRVAIFTPASHPSLEAIEKGFRETLLEKCEVDFHLYNGQGDPTLIHGEVIDAISKNFDAWFTIGAKCTQIANQQQMRRGDSTPLIYGCLVDPSLMGLENLSGTIEISDYEKLLDAILPKIHGVKTVILVYDPTQWYMDRYADQVQKILGDRGITYLPVEVFSPQEIGQKVPLLITHADAVLVLKDNTVISALSVLEKLSKKNNVPLITSDLDSFEKGADFSFGVEEKVYGEEAALLALKVLRGVPISSVVVDRYILLSKEKGL